MPERGAGAAAATTSRVTLDELRMQRQGELEEQMRYVHTTATYASGLCAAHRRDVQRLLPMLLRAERDVDVVGDGAGDADAPESDATAYAPDAPVRVSLAPRVAAAAAALRMRAETHLQTRGSGARARHLRTSAAGVMLPPSPMPLVPAEPEAPVPSLPPPVLQTLAPNPLSVTYASSLRPLPSDPTRRVTGVGVGGGSIHHRTRKGSVRPSGAHKSGAKGHALGAPADLWRWSVRARVCPSAGLVRKANKCLLTRDWKVAFTEQKFVKAMARIEELQEQGQWSFRQPKRVRDPVERKSHWDYMLEEMRWLQTDYREERKWKLATAYELVHQVALWHRSPPEVRARLCVRRGRLPRVAGEMEESRAGVDAGESAAPREPVEAMDEGEAEAVDAGEDEAMDGGEAEAVDAGEDEAKAMDDGETKEAMDEGVGEDKEGAGVVRDEKRLGAQGAAMHEPTNPSDNPTGSTGEATAAAPAPKGVADDDASGESDVEAPPALTYAEPPARDGPLRAEADRDATLSDKLPLAVVTAVRAPIFSMDMSATSVSPWALLDSLDPAAAQALLQVEGGLTTLDPHELSFAKLFPELPPYAPPVADERDRRRDDGLGASARLVHVSRLLDAKPVLVSTLDPASQRAQGQWLGTNEWALASELSDRVQGVPDGVPAGTPPWAVQPGSLLFARRAGKAPREAPPGGPPAPPARPEARAAQLTWSSEDDAFVTALAKQYHEHWALVADVFNSARLVVPTERRTAWDCFDRCRWLAAPSSDAAQRPAVKTEGSRRKQHRAHLAEAMRKSAKRREAAQRQAHAAPAPKRAPAAVAGDAQAKAIATPTPQALSMLKAERDQAAIRQFFEQQRAAQFAFAQQQQRLQMAQAQQQSSDEQRKAAAAATSASTPVKSPVGGSSSGTSRPSPAPLPRAQGAQGTPPAQFLAALSNAQGAKQHPVVMAGNMPFVRPPYFGMDVKAGAAQAPPRPPQPIVIAASSPHVNRTPGGSTPLDARSTPMPVVESGSPSASAVGSPALPNSLPFGVPGAPNVAAATAPTNPVRPAAPVGQPPLGAPAGGQPLSAPPPNLHALQQQLAITLAASHLSQEQINGLAVQLYKQAQAQQAQAQAQAQQSQAQAQQSQAQQRTPDGPMVPRYMPVNQGVAVPVGQGVNLGAQMPNPPSGQPR